MDQDALLQVATWMPLFPVVGALIGLLAGTFVWAVGFVLPMVVVGALGVGLLLLLNGVQHFDGLLDLGDGLMCHGTRTMKIRVMRDAHCGAGAVALGLIVLITTAAAISMLVGQFAVQSLVVSEAAAKFAMVLQARLGTPAQKGMGSLLIRSMKGKHENARLGGATLLTVLIIAVCGFRGTGALIFAVGILVPLLVLPMCNRAFGGITGDVMGATNELTRLASLIVILGASRWV